MKLLIVMLMTIVEHWNFMRMENTLHHCATESAKMQMEIVMELPKVTLLPTIDYIQT